MKCACGRFESAGIPQLEDGVLHLVAAAVPDTCEVQALRARLAALEAALAAMKVVEDRAFAAGAAIAWARAAALEEAAKVCDAWRSDRVVVAGPALNEVAAQIRALVGQVKP